MTREELESFRHRGNCTYGYKVAFCDSNSCCEDCDKYIRFLCRIMVWIENVQEKRILKICKKES